MELYGRLVSKEDLTRRVGQISQIAGARASELSSGLAKGVAAIDVKTGTGFEFTALPGRALDIAWASYKGAPSATSPRAASSERRISSRTAPGVSPQFLRRSSDHGRPQQRRSARSRRRREPRPAGRISNVPAEDVCVSQGWQGDDYKIRLAGTVRQARTFGECLVLHREITTQLGANALVVRDVVENAGNRPEPMMLLYHCNFGYPLVSADSRIYTSGGGVEPRERHAGFRRSLAMTGWASRRRVTSRSVSTTA